MIIGNWPVLILKFIPKKFKYSFDLTLIGDECIVYEVILLYGESVGIDIWLKSCRDRYSMVVMIIFIV